ncbi:MAG: polyprenol monophosphomannose synthase [Candidatus Diapherotrites archaeon]|uniref:Polyprenol monophosphomannose synthase n=1 Tax=Candidatus Iainarchaeum sp. TaxID=3101447 RepID=A0A7J4KS05_9ARCH|nr:polyprenol monophosphomannose synthase [Candidatus Diapherotrites archaeon]HIH21119.1 polyprenol monophosphomannose synthase [Candidatus Diapherotrites archaeon]HIH32811.1 polyprenol monophosphomannose synthase [Candidatus Diapherotrites archaeon]
MFAVVIPTYNEASNIRLLAKEVLSVGKEFSVIIVDDDSGDGTGKIAEELRRKSPKRVFVIHRKKKRGLGGAYIAGFKKALELNAKLVFSMDADFSHDPKVLPEFAEKISQGFDVVLGSRYIKGGGVSWTGTRLALSKGANTLAKTLLGIPANDLTTGFRCYKREVLGKIGLDSVRSNGYSFLEEVLYLCYKKGFRIGEIPIFFKNRTEGQSKLGRKEILNFFLTVIRLKLKG